jgi:L-ascorbate metabolism protein UlaG (beta-lactamase superfamily)
MVRELRRPDLNVRVPFEAGARLPDAAPRRISATWIGHATYALRIGGLTILTDPVWSDLIPGVRRRLAPPGLGLEAVAPVDAVVISHNHYDHLDAPTIRRLPRNTPIFVPGMLGAWFRRRSFTRVTELDWWNASRVGDVTITFTPAHHWSRRGMRDTCKTLWGGWLFTYGDLSIHFAGDSGYGPRLAEIGARFPGLDLAILPIGAYQPAWFMQRNHLNPEEAVAACGDLGAARMATMHWGTFVLSAEPILEPPQRATAAWAAAGRAEGDLFNLPIGGSAVIEGG